MGTETADLAEELVAMSGGGAGQEDPPEDTQTKEESEDGPILNVIPSPTSTATSIADSLARIVERRRLERELDERQR